MDDPFQILKHPENIQNHKNLILQVAAAGWMCAGIPSRSYMRDINY